MLIIAIKYKKVAETEVPISPPAFLRAGMLLCINVAAIAMAIDKATTMVEWPSEKKKPNVTGRLFYCINLRVTLSIAEI